MTDSSATQPPGWYYAQGDPPGTQRYWDGSQWVGSPQAAQGAGAGEPASYGQAGFAAGGAGNPAEYGSRVIAYLIDAGIVLAVYIVFAILALIAGAISDGLGTLVGLVGLLAYIGVLVWNTIIRQGTTGQSIGKEQQNIKLVADATGQPVGGGMAFVRLLVAGVISFVSCGIAGLLDYLWPLWDQDKKRLTDKILNFSVVNA
ncbi:MAG: RDD family protein [Actinomycetia bacterium]|nr:RDD family protein [Actinomycetes bacterium]